MVGGGGGGGWKRFYSREEEESISSLPLPLLHNIISVIKGCIKVHSINFLFFTSRRGKEGQYEYEKTP